MPRKILVPIDLAQQDAAQAALAQARQIDAEAEITLLHVLPRIPEFYASSIPDEVFQSNIKNAKEELREFANRNGLPEAKIELRQGAAGREILDYAGDAKSDLIVIASHDPGWEDFLLGSVAAFVVRNAHCSVLVVRNPEGQ